VHQALGLVVTERRGREATALDADKVLIEGTEGVIVSKGQPIFKVTPDEKFVEVNAREIEKEKRARTAEYLQAIL
jgi:hypothetical protein